MIPNTIPKLSTLNSRFHPIEREIYPTFRIHFYKVLGMSLSSTRNEWAFFTVDVIFQRGKRKKSSGYRILIDYSPLFIEEAYRIYALLKSIVRKYGQEPLSLMLRFSNHKLCARSKQARAILKELGFVLQGKAIIDAEPYSLAYYLKKKVMRICEI